MLDKPERPEPGSDRAAHDPDFDGLTGAEAATGRTTSRPKVVAIGCLGALRPLGWRYLALMLAGPHTAGHLGAHGPGMAVLAQLLAYLNAGGISAAWIEALCAPSFGAAAGAMGMVDAA